MNETGAKGRVMVVDDDPLAIEVARERLEGAGYQVIEHHGPIGTKAAALRERPDFVLLDVNMPAISGDAIARLMTDGRRGRRAVVILYSSKDAAELAALAQSCGAIGFVQKTHDAKRFLDQFEACIATCRTTG